MHMEQAALRAKAGGQSGTYFEWRTPSASANPYLVLAGIVAAGLDGIKNEILPVSNGGCSRNRSSRNFVDFVA